MDSLQIAGVLVTIFAFGGLGVLFYSFSRGAAATRQHSAGLRGLMPSTQGMTFSARRRARAGDEDDEEGDLFDIEQIKERTGHSGVQRQEQDLNTKLFQAGIFAPDEKRKFHLSRMVMPLILAPALCLSSIFSTENVVYSTLGFLLGGLIGYALPMTLLERKIRNRHETTLYYLPLVIEQISIGVSSSLDIGPCLSMLVQMANDRDSHNPVTEMFIHCEKLMRSGLSLEESLAEVAEANGQHEVKHAFLFLAQCSKHGGEISKQLQELADAVMIQRQVFVEGRISQLPVKATGPLGSVFAGFFGLLFAGLVVRLMEAFGGG